MHMKIVFRDANQASKMSSAKARQPNVNRRELPRNAAKSSEDQRENKEEIYVKCPELDIKFGGRGHFGKNQL